MSGQEHIYTTVRRAPAELPRLPPHPDDLREFNVEDIYQYATNTTYQLEGDSPPPPAPPSPPNHVLQQPHHPPHSSPGNHGHMNRNGQQKAFASVVYQPASLHDVDSANMVI